MLIAYHGKQETKDFYMERIKAHAKADEIIKGQYWESGKGCAVGCTIHGSDHGAYETELGVPIILARLEDHLFENLENGEAKKFPQRFLMAIRPGADLSMVWPKYAVWLLTDPAYGVLRHAKKGGAQYIAIERVATLYRELESWDKRDKVAFESARKECCAAAYAYAYAYAAASAAASAVASAAASAVAFAAYLPTRCSTAASKPQPAEIKHPALILIIFPSSKCCAAY